MSRIPSGGSAGTQVAAKPSSSIYTLLTIIALDDLWVDANFKESQLAHIRIGQPAKVESDLYGGAVETRIALDVQGGVGAALQVAQQHGGRRIGGGGAHPGQVAAVGQGQLLAVGRAGDGGG